MNKTAIIPFFMCIVCVSIIRIQAENYTLDQLISEGFKNSAEIKKIRKEMERVNAQIDEAYGRALPSVSVSANYQYAPEAFNALGAGMGTNTLSLQDVVRNQGDPLDPGDVALSGILDQTIASIANTQAPPHSASLSINLQQPVFAQGKVSTGLKIAKAGQRSLVCKMQDAEQRTRAHVTRLFYGAMMARDNVAVQDETAEIAGENHRLAVIRHALGSGSEFDTLSSRLNLQQVRLEYENAQSDYGLALEALVEGTGIEDSPDSVQLSGSFPDDEFDITLDDALERMEIDNKQLGQLQSGEQIQQHLLTLSKTDFFPQVFVGGSLSKISLFDRGEEIIWYDDQKIFAGIQMNLFTGMQRVHKIRQARAELERFQINRGDVLSKLKLAVKSAHKKMQLARRQVRQTGSMIALAEKGHDIAKKSYEIGQKTLVELQMAELRLKQARMGHNAARLNYYMAVVDLRLLMGDFNSDYRY